MSRATLFRRPVSGGVFLALMLISLPLAAQEKPEIAVRLAPVTSESIIRELDLNGTVIALRRSSLSSSVAGLVSSVTVEAGDRVQEDQPLVRLDPELTELALSSARAQTGESRADLAEARRRLKEARSVGVGGNIAATEVSARESEVARAQARLERLEAEEQRQAARLRRHDNRAPFSGVVSARHSDPGEWVTPGDQLLELVDTHQLRLDFQVPQRYYRLLEKQDAELRVQPPEEDTAPVTAPILARVPVTDPRTRTFLLRAGPPDDLTLLPGMAVEATLRLGTGEKGLTVHRDAINRYPDGRITVWIASEEDSGHYRVRERRVTPGIAFDNRIEIRDGLEGGEQVVVRGNNALENDSLVRVSREENR